MIKLYCTLFIIGVCITLSLLCCCRVEPGHGNSCKGAEKSKISMDYYQPKYLFTVYDVKVYRFADQNDFHYIYIKKKDVEGIPENIRIEENN